MTSLVVAEHDNQHLKARRSITLSAGARAGRRTIDMLVAGASCRAVAEEAAKLDLEGVAKVLLAEEPSAPSILRPKIFPRSS